MKPGKSVDVKEEIAEIHTAARSPSPKQKSKRSRSQSGSRKLSNGHAESPEKVDKPPPAEESTSEKSKRDSWIKSEHESVELPIHEQLKQGILGFVEKEIQKPDNPSFVFYSHDPNGLDDKFMKSMSRPSSGHKEKRSPSYRKKKRHSSRHRDRELHDFEVPGSSLSALEKVDDYLKEYNKDEVVTLSGELEIENDAENNNESKELRHKPRKTRRKVRDERQDSNANGKGDVSPKVFKSGSKSKTGSKSARPTDLTAMLHTLESSLPYHDQYIDNPFSSPSPVTSPNDERLNPFSRRPEKIYLQGGGTFRAVSRDRILESQQSREGDKYLRLGDLTPLDLALTVQKAWRSFSPACHGILGELSLMHLLLISVRIPSFIKVYPLVSEPLIIMTKKGLGDLTPLDLALTVQKAWRSFSPACHGILGGLSLMHLLLISYSDGLDAGHLSFHAVVTMPYVATYYFFCVLCLLSVLDRLDITSMEISTGIQPYFQPIVLVILYTACLLVCCAARMYDDLMVYQYADIVSNITANVTTPTIPSFYHTWTHFSIWRAVLSILGLVYFIISNPPDLVYNNLSKLLQFKQSLQSIG